MSARVLVDNGEVAEREWEDAQEDEYDVGIWVAGYEARSRWLIQSEYRPGRVSQWMRVEFVEERTACSAPENLKIPLGEVFGGGARNRAWDGEWLRLWCNLIEELWRKHGREPRIFIDMSSMPRTVYGTAILACLRYARVGCQLTIGYVPGQHASDIDGAKRVEGLRALVGTSGSFQHEIDPALVVCAGFDGVLVQGLVDMFQCDCLSMLLPVPGATDADTERVRIANSDLIRRCDLIGEAPALSLVDSFAGISRLCDWYQGLRDVVLVPVGPKPQVVAALLVALARQDVAYRWVVASSRPLEVTVGPGVRPVAFSMRRGSAKVKPATRATRARGTRSS